MRPEDGRAFNQLLEAMFLGYNREPLPGACAAWERTLEKVTLKAVVWAMEKACEDSKKYPPTAFEVLAWAKSYPVPQEKTGIERQLPEHKEAPTDPTKVGALFAQIFARIGK